MHAAELARRRPVWDALSQVFLDSETRWSFPWIAHVLVDSGYSAAERERIWRYEVTPECVWNTWSVAGEWAAMPLDEPALIRRASQPPGRLAWLWWRRTRLHREWRAICALADLLAQLAPCERAARVTCWRALIECYLEPPAGTPSAVAHRGPRHDELARDLRPIFRSLLIGAERASVDESRRAAAAHDRLARDLLS